MKPPDMSRPDAPPDMPPPDTPPLDTPPPDTPRLDAPPPDSTSPTTTQRADAASTGEQPQVGLVVAAMFVMVAGQMTVLPVLAPLARSVALAEWQMGVMMSVAALAVVLTSTLWGRSSQARGSKPVLIAAMLLGAMAMAGFAVVSGLGMVAALGGTTLFGLIVLSRGVLFGTAMSAVLPTAQTYITNVTATEQARVKGMAALGAAQGMGLVVGAAVGGGLSLMGIMAPLIAVPIILATMAGVLAGRLRPDAADQLIAKPQRVSPFDRRVLPYLLVTFAMFTALGFFQILIGFLIADRYSLSRELVATAAGGSNLASGIGMIISQAGVVPRLGWPPRRLILVGTAISVVGIAMMIPSAALALLIFGAGLIGIGMGIAVPGVMAGPTLVVEREERGAVAGLIGATLGLTFVVSPTLGTVLYRAWPPLPLIVAAAWMAAAHLLVVLHPRFRRAPDSALKQA